MSYDKPLPRFTSTNRPYWDSLNRGKFSMQCCEACGHMQFPPQPSCANCLSFDHMGWKEVSGRGRIWSGIVMHKTYIRSFGPDTPYNVVMVQLEEGPLLMSTLIDGNDRIECDAPVEVVLDRVTEDLVLPKFKLSGGAS